ncbi:MAG: ABC transporter ATP-binding protein [Bacillota bacterium]
MLRDVHKTYRIGKVEVPALRGITLEVEEGEFTSVMGPSGSGKSTLLNIIGCLDHPGRGTYILGGREVNGLGDAALAAIRNRMVGFVFQSFHLLLRMTARQNVELPLVYRGVPPRERRRRAEEALAAVGLEAEASRRPTELSGGQQQRVAIARALVGEPALLLADEPTGNLDSRTGEELMELFSRLNRERGITILQVTHDERMARYSRRVVRLQDGQIVSDGPPHGRPSPATRDGCMVPAREDGGPGAGTCVYSAAGDAGAASPRIGGTGAAQPGQEG